MTSGDSLERLRREVDYEGARMLAREKSRRSHDAFLAQVDARLAALGASWSDLLGWSDDEDRPGAGGGQVASGQD
jgi:hypothetical protein